MARKLTLAERVVRFRASFFERPIESLSKTARTEAERLARQLGVSVERLFSWAPSTRRRYLSAARQGRNVSQERERVRTQRREREKRRAVQLPRIDERRRRIEELRAWLNERINTDKSPFTQTDELDEERLLSPDSIDEHIKVYGVDYVLKQLEGMRQGYIDKPTAESRWHGFKASSVVPDHPDERWYWYHGTLRMGGIGPGMARVDFSRML